MFNTTRKVTEIPFPQQQPDDSSQIEEDRQKHRKRAERFGTDFLEPKARRDHQKEAEGRAVPGAFRTGLDVYSEEELAKQRDRAARFETQAPALNYTPVEEDADEAKRRERAARFGTEYHATDHSGLNNEDLLEERKEHGAAVTRRPDAVHLYGVDKMSTKEVLQYFDSYGPLRVEWIDDSSCNVVFGDQHSAKRAIVGLGRPLGPGEAPDLQGLDAADIANLPFLWHKGVDFCKQSGGTRVPLIYRTATVEDKKGMAPTQGSRFLWLRNGKMQKQGGKRARPVFDDDGDVAMADASMAAGSHAKRLKPSRQKRKERRANTQGGGEVDMQDAEDVDDTAAEPASGSAELEGQGLAAGPSTRDVPDLRDTLPQRRSDRGPSGLFSAARAGLVPAFLVPHEERTGAEDLSEEAAMDANGHAAA